MDSKNLTLDEIRILAEGEEAEFITMLQLLLAEETVANPLISFMLGARFGALKREEQIDG